MKFRQFFVLSLALAGCAATAYTVGRHNRHLEKRKLKKRQLKEDLHNWENEGGNLAPSAPLAAPGSAAPV